jgi:hypothetical protein
VICFITVNLIESIFIRYSRDKIAKSLGKNLPIAEKQSFCVCTVEQRVVLFGGWLVLSQVRVELKSGDIEGTDNAENVFRRLLLLVGTVLGEEKKIICKLSYVQVIYLAVSTLTASSMALNSTTLDNKR